MARFGYVLALMLTSGLFLAPSPWVRWVALGLYAAHALHGVTEAIRRERWWSTVGLASLYVYQGAFIPMLLLTIYRTEDLLPWVVTLLSAIAVNFWCGVVAWVKSMRIAVGIPSRPKFSDYVGFRWLDSVEA